MKSNRVALFGLRTALLIACSFVVTAGCAPAEDGGPPARLDRIHARYEGYTIDDLAHYLAADSAALPESFAVLTKDPAYRRLATAMNEAWARYDAAHLGPVRAWRQNLEGKYGREIFYPFGGPDVVHPVLLFPNARRYTLFGLERTGRIPEPPFADPARSAEEIGIVHDAVRGVLGRNFFLTLKMTAIGRKSDSGVGAILLFFLGRLEYEVLDAYPIRLASDGRIVPAVDGVRPQGMRVYFRPAADEEIRELNYFQLNLSDANLPKMPGLREYLERQREITTMLKAASYLLYLDAFDDVRAMILERSKLILSDPSGMPFHFLKGRRLTGYGKYVGPIGLFPVRYEPDRRAFYARGGLSPLPFAYGYHPTSPSLLLAERADAVVTSPLRFDGHDTEGITTFFRNGRQVILGDKTRSIARPIKR